MREKTEPADESPDEPRPDICCQDTNRARVNSNLLVQTVLAVSGLDEASGDEEIEAALKRLTDDSIEGDPEVRQQARVALGKLRASSTG